MKLARSERAFRLLAGVLLSLAACPAAAADDADGMVVKMCPPGTSAFWLQTGESGDKRPSRAPAGVWSNPSSVHRDGGVYAVCVTGEQKRKFPLPKEIASCNPAAARLTCTVRKYWSDSVARRSDCLDAGTDAEMAGVYLVADKLSKTSGDKTGNPFMMAILARGGFQAVAYDVRKACFAEGQSDTFSEIAAKGMAVAFEGMEEALVRACRSEIETGTLKDAVAKACAVHLASKGDGQ